MELVRMVFDMSEEWMVRDVILRFCSHRGGCFVVVCAAVLLMGTASCGSSDESPQSLPSAIVLQDAASASFGWQIR